jgi:hypothetical protein
MTIRALWPRASMIALAALTCIWLASTAGAWAAFGLWIGGTAVICGGVGFLMHAQKSGRVSFINYLAAWVLPWGFKIGQGKLLPIVIESWVRWVLLGIAIFVATAPNFKHIPSAVAFTEYRPSATIMTLIALSWVIDGAVVLRIATMLVIRAKTSPIGPGILRPTVGLALLMTASVVLWLIGHNAMWTTVALLLAGGPIVLIGGGYGLFVLFIVTFGRKTRWN